jgi:type I restriction enzyme S subunit
MQNLHYLDMSLKINSGNPMMKRENAFYHQLILVTKFNQSSSPPLAEQHCIVARVDVLMKLCDALEVQLKERAAVQGRLANTIVKGVVS